MNNLPSLPQTLKIGGHYIDIAIGTVSSECCSEWDRKENKITISDSLSHSQQWSSLFHEILHVQNAQLENTEIAHMLLDSLSEQLFQVMADNGLLK